MGVTGLFKFLKDKFGDDIYEYIHMSHYSYKVIYYDISSHIFSYIKIYGNLNNSWLNGFVKIFMLFKKYKIHLIPVFDGKSPTEKKEEREDRKSQCEKSDIKCMNISMDLEGFINTGKITDLLKETMSRIKKDLNKRILKTTICDSKADSDIVIDPDQIKEYIDKKETALTDITKNDIDKLKELMDQYGIPYLEAKDEAETLCNDLVRRGLGYATYSLDSDCVAYDIPYIINDLDMNSHVFRVINMKKLLELINLTHSQLRDLCILCGVDYNRHTKPKSGLGPVSAYKLIKEHGCFKNIMKVKNIDSEGYRYDRCNELFSLTYPEHTDVYVWKEIDVEKLREYLIQNSLFCNILDIRKYWKPIQLEFID